MRIVGVLAGIGAIIGSLFGHMAVTYLAAGYVEEQFGSTVPGVGHIVVILSLMLGVVMIIATLLTLAERKWSAMMQDRIGPNRARIGDLPIVGKLPVIGPILQKLPLAGLPHVLTDVFKMLTKEAFQPGGANAILFKLAPMLAFAPAFALFAVVPAGPNLTLFGKDIVMSPTNPDFGLLYMFAIASLAVYGTSLAGWSSNNKFALLGGVRASSQMISYEVALGLSLVGMMMAFSTVKMAGPTGMAQMQETMLWSTKLGPLEVGLQSWGFMLQPLGFLLFFAAAFAETKRAPFDTPEGESEIVGYFIEYSGMQFGMFMISEFVEVVVLSGVLVAIFFGGWSVPFVSTQSIIDALPRIENWPNLTTALIGGFFGLVFWVKVVLLCYLQLAIRWTFPRFRYDQVQTLGWKILLPIGLANVFVSGALILWDPSLRSLALFGLVELGVMLFLTLTPTRQQRTAAQAHGHDSHSHDDHSHHAPALSAGSSH
jgi:NADH-quinone oxidoreductase subunit H